MVKKILRVGIVVLVMAALAGCGREPSRILGKDYRQTLHVENLKEFVSLSFRPSGGSTVKDVTFLAEDGYVYTKEFKDVSPLEGTIRWVPADHSESIIQTRALSRWTGKPVNLKLPVDCIKVLGVDVGNSSKSNRVKNLTYLSKDGHIYSKEYREGFISRHFDGWLEITTTK